MSPRILRLLAIIAVPVILLALLSSYIVEWMWLDQLGYSRIFWTVRGAQVLLTVAAFIMGAAYLVPNFRYLSDQLKNINFAGTPLQNLNIDLAMHRHHQNVKRFLTFFALAFAFVFAIGFYISWDESLRFIWNESFGAADPLFNKDIGFYLFQLPFWDLIQTSLAILSFLVLAILLLAYILTGLLTGGSGRGIEASPSVFRHLTLNAAFWLLMVSWGFYLSRYNLLFRSDGIIFGAGYSHVSIELPALWLLTLLSLLLAILLLAGRRVSRRVLSGAALLTLAVMILGRVIVPALIQNFSVEPNELELETPYLENNIAMTRLAYDLNKIQEIDYEADDTLRIGDIRNNLDAIQNIRLWDSRLLLQTYRQLQEIRSYYEFYTVDNDRYVIDGEVTQTMLSAREIAHILPSQSDTWVNRHLQYTHGYGLVMNSVTETSRQGEPRFLLGDIPPVPASPELAVDNPSIYYGENSDSYYIVNTHVPELNYPSGNENAYNHYDGTGGVQLNSWGRRLLFAWELRDINIILSDYLHEESRLQIWRSVQDRISRITPFLQLDQDPYLVLNEGRLYWIQDAYTTSSHFPYSQPYGNFNYIRNSVKIVVDSYDGTVDYYVVDEEDPVLQVYRSIFPDLFQPLENLTEGLQAHFRYPQGIFEVQQEMFNRYHMRTPQVFYNQEDLWTRPSEKYAGQRTLMDPYYVLARLPGEEELEFMLISPTTPENRDNMISWLAAKSDIDSYGELLIYRLPKDRLIYGPAQIEARIDQDPLISRQIALWDQRGSRVLRGNLMVIPIENSFIYVEPVFLIAEGVDIPQLQRVIVAIGDAIAMQPTIEGAILELFGEEADFILPPTLPVTEPFVTEGEILPPALDEESSRLLDEIRNLWNELRNALEEQEWTRYGELLQDLDEMIESE